MKKKFLSFVIALVMLCGGLVFSACGDSDKGYQLTNLATDYRSYVGDVGNVILGDSNNANSITFNYDSYVSSGKKYLSEKVNSTAANNPYAYLNTFYNVILDNSMAFIYNYIDVCSNETIVAPSTLRNKAKINLDKFNTSLKRTSGNVEAVADQIRQGKSEQECLDGLKNLFDSYGNLYQSAFNLTSSLTDIYYNYAITDSNPDYSKTKIEDYNSSKTLILLKSRTKQHIADMTQSYLETNVYGSDLSRAWTTVGATISLPSQFTDYYNKINAVNYYIDDTFSTKVNESASKQAFLNNAIALYNYQSVLDNDATIYRQASNDIVYLELVNDADATHYEKYCVEIIDNHSYTLNKMNKVFADMITILWSV